MQNPPNNGTLNDVGALGIDVHAVNTFEIVGPDTALAVLSPRPQRRRRSTPINLTSGAARSVGSIPLAPSGQRVRSVGAAESA